VAVLCRRRSGTREQQQERAQRDAVTEAKRLNSALDKCSLCFSAPARSRELTLSVGQHTYLLQPARGRLSPGHCVIAPTEHAPSFRDVDDHIYEELKNFKKSLIRMHMEQVRPLQM
jgi:hypothetical protein